MNRLFCLIGFAATFAAAQHKIEIIEEGTGEDMPVFDAWVWTHFTGTLEDGTEFDSSHKRKKPYKFNLGKGRALKCFDEAFKELKMGAKAKVTCPPEMGYGKKASKKVPADSTLIFEVELIDFYNPG